MAGYEYELEKPTAAQGGERSETQGFFLEMARLQVEAKLRKQFEVELSLELSDLFEPTPQAELERPELLRDAFLEARFRREVRLRVGHFKRPFSRVELRSGFRLPMRDRGLLNDLLIEEARWGDRALGAMLWGKFKQPKLSWHLAMMEADWHPELDREGYDVIARLAYEPWRWLSVAANAGRKSLTLTDETVTGHAFGGDLRLRLGNAEVTVEGNYGEQLLEPGAPGAFGALLLFTYDVELTSVVVLQPVLFAELADAHAEFEQTEAVRVVAGANVVHHDTFRVAPQIAVTRPLGDVSVFNPWEERVEGYLMIALGL